MELSTTLAFETRHSFICAVQLACALQAGGLAIQIVSLFWFYKIVQVTPFPRLPMWALCIIQLWPNFN